MKKLIHNLVTWSDWSMALILTNFHLHRRFSRKLPLEQKNLFNIIYVFWWNLQLLFKYFLQFRMVLKINVKNHYFYAFSMVLIIKIKFAGFFTIIFLISAWKHMSIQSFKRSFSEVDPWIIKYCLMK